MKYVISKQKLEAKRDELTGRWLDGADDSYKTRSAVLDDILDCLEPLDEPASEKCKHNSGNGTQCGSCFKKDVIKADKPASECDPDNRCYNQGGSVRHRHICKKHSDSGYDEYLAGSNVIESHNNSSERIEEIRKTWEGEATGKIEEDMQTLLSHIDQLEEALEEIATHIDSGNHAHACEAVLMNIAIKALTHKTQETDKNTPTTCPPHCSLKSDREHHEQCDCGSHPDDQSEKTEELVWEEFDKKFITPYHETHTTSEVQEWLKSRLTTLFDGLEMKEMDSRGRMSYEDIHREDGFNIAVRTFNQRLKEERGKWL